MPYLVGMERPKLLVSVEEPKAEEEPSSVIHHIDIFMRLEVIRTKKHQTQYQPLQPYMDEKLIGEHARPWQQMLMFFWQTQQEHAWKSPKRVEDGEEEDKEQPGANLDNKMTEDADSVGGEREEAPVVGVSNIGKPETLSSIKKSITRKEYDSPLVYILAVLGVRKDR
ncbi:uncharacterized protein CC84DRAFT_1191159 [Paraphaeosphaeria sporulosa]|uniref:Uncharacterized protein n=1 Tax=Paraphaeosphaeria sporulosa TaxID=1460663 RepID=A0A177BZU2_9PLEO|nr:uncharacterized protein CC84DRAFT_1191159 [Paraphaeosphaeria sporulosa]OAF99859.1 hypothetical protein CC84DRAFT_1191159 [Paraphaeosphaeria sporulosa]